MINLFDLGIDNWKVGDFVQDEIVKFEIKDREDYQPFIDLLNERKTIPMAKFWKKNKKALAKIAGYKNNPPKDFEKQHSYLKKVNDDYDFSDKFNANKSLGDAVICVGVPAGDILVTMDRFQDHLRREVLEKDCLLVAKKQD